MLTFSHSIVVNVSEPMFLHSFMYENFGAKSVAKGLFW
jgi:hypothetical protein